MAGHSQFKNIMYRKSAQDKKRSKLYSKMSREIMVAAKSGSSDPEHNSRLRAAISNAKEINLPKANIVRAIKKSQILGKDNFLEVRYECFGPEGVAILIEALTDNKNRTVTSVRTALQKVGGRMGEAGSIIHLFKHVGVLEYFGNQLYEKCFEAAVDAGAEDVVSENEGMKVICEIKKIELIRKVLSKLVGESDKYIITWQPLTMIDISEEATSKLYKLFELLGDDEDIQNIYSNLNATES